jgi:hypothetical protein
MAPATTAVKARLVIFIISSGIDDAKIKYVYIFPRVYVLPRALLRDSLFCSVAAASKKNRAFADADFNATNSAGDRNPPSAPM